MTTLALPAARIAANAVETILKGMSQIDTFRGGVLEENVKYDSDKKVHGYAVLFAGVGNAPINRLVPTPDHRRFRFQITVAGGDDNRCIWVADLVVGALVGRKLSISDGITSTVQQVTDPGPIQIDRMVNPPRHWLPLLFECRLSKR